MCKAQTKIKTATYVEKRKGKPTHKLNNKIISTKWRHIKTNQENTLAILNPPTSHPLSYNCVLREAICCTKLNV
jgi:hypothetical protein